jgi:hypothetical protein
MDDALSIVQDMDFIGASSKPFKGKSLGDMRNGKFCTMPIKFRFEDRDSRIHFETSVRKYCTLKASMSLPKPIREEQAAFAKIVRERYPGEIVAVRVDTLGLELRAYRKLDGQKQWTKCQEAASSGSPGGGPEGEEGGEGGGDRHDAQQDGHQGGSMEY